MNSQKLIISREKIKKNTKILVTMLMVLILIFNINCITYANTDNSNNIISLTIEAANEYASEFADIVSDNNDIYTERTIKIHNVNSNAIGYCIDLYSNNIPNEYCCGITNL